MVIMTPAQLKWRKGECIQSNDQLNLEVLVSIVVPNIAHFIVMLEASFKEVM